MLKSILKKSITEFKTYKSTYSQPNQQIDPNNKIQLNEVKNTDFYINQSHQLIEQISTLIIENSSVNVNFEDLNELNLKLAEQNNQLNEQINSFKTEY